SIGRALIGALCSSTWRASDSPWEENGGKLEPRGSTRSMAPFSLSRRGVGALSFGALLLVAAQGRADAPAEEGRANSYAEERALREGSGRDAVPSKELAEASSEGPAEDRGPVAEAQAHDDLSEPLAEKETSAVVPQGVGD